MSVLPQLLSLARQYRYAWARPPQLHCVPAALRAAAASAACLPPAVPPHAASSSSRGLCSSPHRQQQRRSVAAAAGRRGNVFLDPDSAPKRRQKAGDDDEPTSLLHIFDSSRFNYDSDEDEEEEQQLQQHEGDAAAHGSATAAAAAAQQQRRRQRGAAAAAGAELAAAAAAEGEEPVDVVLPPPRGVRVKSAEFVKSSVNVEQCPQARFPEFAVIGRSNVGKSSLINMLTGRSSLAMVSKTPGKTRCINHFIINGAWYLVDLPGYGYARTSKGNVVEWNRFTREYFLERETLVTVLLLVDASIPPMALDVSCAAWFAEAEIPFTIVFTKLDKRKKGVPPAEENIAAFEQELTEACGYLPPTILTSSKSGKGRNELLSHIAQLRDFFNKSRHGM